MGTVKMGELSGNDYHQKLLEAVKAQVKAIMEESVTKKFVHEESEHVLRLCATVQTCLLDRLRKRTAGFLRTNKIANLFNKIGKSIPEVAQLVVKIEEAESNAENQASQEGKNINGMKPHTVHARQLKQIWVRIALTEKLLDKILEYLVNNSSKFYEKNAILSDRVHGGILASLLVGPCALEYTKMKTSDHYWSDPPADELLQRHKLHCRSDSASPYRRPTLKSTSKYGSSEQSEKNGGGNGTGNTFREYVESLHQNSKSTLLYGKNNVVVQPREELKPIHGYLSLHQVANALCIKWTPNQLMNVNEQKKSVNCNHEPADSDDNTEGTRRSCLKNDIATPHSSPRRIFSFLNRDKPSEKPKKLLSYWEYAISVDVRDVVYLHCHQRSDSGGTLVLVGQDGVQRPPICFPPGGHLLAFLTCLETGLLPHGHLDPPLWSQHGKGKVFPRLRNRSSRSSSSSAGSQSEAEEATDFVFRVTTGKSNTIHSKGSRDPSPPADTPTTPPISQSSFFEKIMSTLSCDPLSTVPKSPVPQRRRHSSKKSQRSSVSSHSVLITDDIGKQAIYDKNLFYESLISPPPTFSSLHFVFLSHQGGGPVINDRLKTTNQLPDEVIQGLQLLHDKEPVMEAGSLQESFDAYSIGSNYSCYDSQEFRSKPHSSRSSLKVLCETMRRQIISRAFYGWLAHCRHLTTVRTHLSALVLPDHCQLPKETVSPIDSECWKTFLKDGKVDNEAELMERVYFGGIDHSMRNTIWPYLLSHYPMKSNENERKLIDENNREQYENVVEEWRALEKIIKKREKDNLAARISSDSRTSSLSSLDGHAKQFNGIIRKQSTLSDVFVSIEHDNPPQHAQPVSDVNENSINHLKENGIIETKRRKQSDGLKKTATSRGQNDHTPYTSISTEPSSIDRRFSNITINSQVLSLDEDPRLDNIAESDRENQSSTSTRSNSMDSDGKSSNRKTPPLTKQQGIDMQNSIEHTESIEEEEECNCDGNQENMHSQKNSVVDVENSIVEYSTETLENFSLNLQRIEKDVHRCDRNHDYFTEAANLEKLRNVMCSYVWKHLDVGYMQGMCDLAAPLLVVMDDESLVCSCFTELMKIMGGNFSNRGAMDGHFANMRSLLQVLDCELFEHMHRNGDYTHFYFCYRWFLLDFKRELSYENDVFAVWERIWAARQVCSGHFVLFFALALLHNYRDIILDNEMDFTDIIKFFNEMAERHNAMKILKLAQNFVYEVQSMISK